MSAYGLTHRGQRIAAYSNREAARLARTSVFGHLKGVKLVKISAAKRKNPTKAQKREKARKASVQRRVAVALAKFLKQANPAMKTAGATVTRLKGGGFTIRPIRAVKRR